MRRRDTRGSVTLARALSKLGISSRAVARTLVLDGRVRVNGAKIRDPDRWVVPSRDRIVLDGEAARPRCRVYYVMNKPPGVVTTRSDEKQRRTVYDLLPPGIGWVFPVGRLDKETSGLLFFTNDTRFGDRVTNPLDKIPKCYAARLDRRLAERDRERLQSGMRLEDGAPCRPARVKIRPEDPTVCEITIVEGKNRQVRRMFEQIGYVVVTLKRLSIGSLRLGGLSEGEVRRLPPRDVIRVMENYAE